MQHCDGHRVRDRGQGGLQERDRATVQVGGDCTMYLHIIHFCQSSQNTFPGRELRQSATRPRSMFPRKSVSRPSRRNVRPGTKWSSMSPTMRSAQRSSRRCVASTWRSQSLWRFLIQFRFLSQSRFPFTRRRLLNSPFTNRKSSRSQNISLLLNMPHLHQSQLIYLQSQLIKHLNQLTIHQSQLTILRSQLSKH